MKKILLSAAVVLGAILSTHAQTILSQPFGTASIPSGWSQTTAAVAADNWKFTNAWGANAASALTMQGYCACIDDWDNNPNQTIAVYDTLKGPNMNCTSSATVYISLNYFFFNDDAAETAQILYSTNGGATWTQAVNLPNTQNDNNYWSNGAIFDISAYAGGQSNVMIAFAYYDGVGNASNNGYVGTGICVQDVDVYAPVSYDLSIISQNSPYLMQVGSPYTFSGTTENYGVTSVTSMNMNYSVNGGAIQTQTISGISGFSTGTNTSWTMNLKQYTPLTAGTCTVKYWADNINGSNTDGNHANDTLVANFMAVDTIQAKTVMFEEFSCASCDPCLYAMTNIDTVSEKNVSVCNTVRYHWYYPGQDMINQETSTLVNTRFENYYGQEGVPVGEVDGAYYYPGAGSLTSAVIQDEAVAGSPIKIDVGSATVDTLTNTYSLSATIKSFGNLPAGLTAQVVLTEDSVNFSVDQSVEDPTSYFAPPIGTGAGNDDPDWMYPLVLNFPDAVEDMLPSVNGTALTAFTAGSTQTINVSWVQNHPWAAKRASYPYDSTATQHFTIFVQDNSANSIFGLPAKYVYQSKRVLITRTNVTGIAEVSNGTSFNMYPNPTNGNTTLAFKLDKDQNVNVQVFNMLGQQVYSDNEGMLSSGQHTILINGSFLQNGVYFVRFNSNNTATTQKLVIQK